MDFSLSDSAQALQSRLSGFMDEAVYPAEATYFDQIESASNRWESPPVMEDLKTRARAAGLWNLFLPESHHGAGLTNVEYAPLCELMGRSVIAPEVFNCNAPDTGNMEVLERYGTEAQKTEWLAPLLEGRIRSAYAMTEPQVASSDATNISTQIEPHDDHYLINGRKWWISGAGDTRCHIFILMGKTNPDADRYHQQSMVLVPRDTPGVRLVRPLTVFGYDHAPSGHWEIAFDDVRVRRALAMAIDRESIVKNVTRGGQMAANYFTPPQTAGYTTRARIAPGIEAAKQLLAEAGYPDGEGFPKTSIIFNTSENHRAIASAIQEMWRKHLNIEVQLNNQEWKVYLDTQRGLDYFISRAGWIGDYVDPNSFLDMWTSWSQQNQTGWSSKEYDQLIARAGATREVEARLELFQQAEEILMAEAPIIPIYIYTRVYLLDPGVKGWYPTILDHHPYKHLYLEPGL